MMKYRNLIAALLAAPPERRFLTHWVDEDERETVSFGQFSERASASAGLLRDHGVGHGDRVVIIMPQTISATSVFIGAMMIGAVPAFLAYPNFKVEPSKYRAGLEGVTANLQAKAIVIDEAFPVDLLAHVAKSTESKLIRATDSHRGLPEEDIFDSAGDDLAFIQHSAGTTGLQKGVALTHTAVLTQLDHLYRVLKVEEDQDSIYSWLPLYHDMGLIACFVLPLVSHLPVVMQSPLQWVMQPESSLEIITECKCTLGWMPNFAFQFIPRRTPRSRWAHYDLSSLRVLINCSEPVRSQSMHEFETAFAASGLRPGVLQASYAMAENVFAVTQTDVNSGHGPSEVWVDAKSFRNTQTIVPAQRNSSSALSFTSSGELLPGNHIRIIDESGRMLAENCVGEILISSDSLLSGYFNRPDLTRSAFLDGWYRSGDLGFLQNGELYVVGRKKDLIIVGGENLYPQDIEEIISSHPAIHDGRSVALGIPNPELGTEELVIVAEVEDEGMHEAETIEAEIRASVVSIAGVAPRKVYLKPAKWIVKSTAGKIARSATREKLVREHPELDYGEPKA